MKNRNEKRELRKERKKQRRRERNEKKEQKKELQRERKKQSNSADASGIRQQAADARRNAAGDSSRRMSSITRKLHLMMVGKKLRIWILSDILLFFLLLAAFAAGIEYRHFSTIPALRDYSRTLTKDEFTRQIWYTITDKNGLILFHKDVTPLLAASCAIVGIILALQLLSLLLSFYGEHKRIRTILSPINEIALRADELSRMSFSEDKYHVLEDAIEHIRPGEAQKLSFQDSDLIGVEAAINNLLIRMRDTYRQQSRFVNDASHELRTPIAVIQGYANMLDRWGKEDEKILDESITAIRNEADHMNHLVEQLLFLARGDSGKTSVSMERVDLSSMMQEVYEESFMIDESHPYRYKAPKETLTIMADPGLLKQAVRILIDNSAKYTKPGDEILLECGMTASGMTSAAADPAGKDTYARSPGKDRSPNEPVVPSSQAYIQVQDTGIGMEEADVQQMFERFYRSDEVRSYQGTGLGLSIAKWIVDKHGAHFEILSRTGLGTRIRIVLPPYTDE